MYLPIGPVDTMDFLLLRSVVEADSVLLLRFESLISAAKYR